MRQVPHVSAGDSLVDEFALQRHADIEELLATGTRLRDT